MTTLTSNSGALRATSRLATAFHAFTAEAAAFLVAMASPRTMLREVDQMRVLLNQAHRIEATQPEHAGALRQQASRIGLR